MRWVIHCYYKRFMKPDEFTIEWHVFFEGETASGKCIFVNYTMTRHQ